MRVLTRSNIIAVSIFSTWLVPFGVSAAIVVVSPPAVTFSVTALLDVVAGFISYFFTLVMIVAVLAVIYGAFQIITAGGDDKRLDSGKKWLLWALVGFGVALLSRGMLTFVCSILSVDPCPNPFK